MHLLVQKIEKVMEKDSLEKLTAESVDEVKKQYEDLQYVNRCCIIIMESYMNDIVYDSLPKTDIVKQLFEKVGKKFSKVKKK